MAGYIMAIAAMFTLYWVSKSRNRVTKFAGLALAFSVLLRFVPFAGIDQYAPYTFGFFTLFAGFEPMSSFRFKNNHKIMFAYSSIASFVFTLQGLVNLPMGVEFELFLIPIPFLTIWLWRNEKKVVYQRIGAMVIWSTQTLLAIYYWEWLGIS